MSVKLAPPVQPQVVPGILPSVFAEQMIFVERSQPLRLDLRPYLAPIYNSTDRYSVLAFGRQCEKSTTLGNKALTYLALIDEYKVLYVVPSHPQLKTFSRERVNNTITRSKNLKYLMKTGYKSSSKNLYDKEFSNLSGMHLRAAYRDADRIRGIRADMVMVDEIQDIDVNLIPIILETAQHSDIKEGKKFMFSGTFKTDSDGLGYYWGKSTQGEYAVKCSHCGHWNVPIGLDNIGKFGLVCEKCGGAIHPLNDEHIIAHGNPSSNIFGIRVPQLIVPSTLNDWPFLLDKLDRYPPAQLHNEVLALPYSIGTRPITEAELRQYVCDENHKLVGIEEEVPGIYDYFMGIDWGYGLNSYTVATILGYAKGNYTIVYAHRFDRGGELEIEYQENTIARLIEKFKPRVAGADWGAGVSQNQKLMKKFPHNFVQYFESEGAKAPIKWNKDMLAFVISRSQLHAALFSLLRRGRIRGPKWSEFEIYAKDILAIETAYNTSFKRITYDHPVEKPDDFFHSLMFALVSAKKYRNEPILD